MKTGLQVLLQNPKKYLGGSSVGLIANPTTVDHELRHAVDLLHSHPEINLVRLFGPEHGLRGDAQYMVSVDDERDAQTQLPVVSLYGKNEESLTPQARHLNDVDILLFDIQDVGSRYYTYAATMALCLRAAGKLGKKVVVLDRPNPIGGTQVEGGGLRAGLENFCGLYAVPQRHGMTVGELARLYQQKFGLRCELEVIACEGWRRSDYFENTGLPWILPSPNMPTVDTALVYPGLCLLEGTTISEGRGTTRPFELFGAPYITSKRLQEELSNLDLPGLRLRPCAFRPTFDKYQGELCQGLQLHVYDRSAFLPYRTGLAVIWAIRKLWPKQFGWRKEPYEFRADVPAFDLLTGFPEVREAIDEGKSFEQVMKLALVGCETYTQGRQDALLY